jgi:hypothetical protein
VIATAPSGQPTPDAFAPWASAIIRHGALALAERTRRAAHRIDRECLDHVVVFGEAHLRLILKVYAAYYNEVRTHLSLDKDAPNSRRPQRFGSIVAIPILGGLHHQYIRV